MLATEGSKQAAVERERVIKEGSCRHALCPELKSGSGPEDQGGSWG